MARFSTDPSTTNPAAPTRNTSGSSTGAKNYDNNASREQRANDTIAEQVINSPAYQSAYQILSAEPNKSWLQRLEMIPYSVKDATSTVFDTFGFTHNRDDKQQANYQYCLQQISQLMADYQSWKNSLPETQVQQFADAGINAAITGNGVNGSDIAPGNAPSANPSSMQSAQPFEIIQGAASFILDATSGLANLALQYKQLGLSTRTQEFNEESALLDFTKYASEHGVHIKPGSTWKDLFDMFTIDDPGASARYSDNLLLKYLTHHSNAPVFAGLAQLYPDMIMTFGDGKSTPMVPTGIYHTPVHLDATNQAMIDLLSAQREYDARIKKFTAETAEYNAGKAFEEKTSAAYNKIRAQYESTRAQIATDLIQKLRDSEHESDKLLLSRILWNATYNTVELERKQNEWFTTDLNLGPLGSVGIMPK